MSILRKQEPWYAKGLAFSCHGCGDCCRGDGYVWIDEVEAGELASFLGITEAEFSQRYLRRLGERRCLIDKPNGDCIFLDGGCSVYEARPTQCRTFPFWPDNLGHEGAWAVTCLQCRGAGSGELYTLSRIRELASKKGATTSGPSSGG